MKMNLMICFVCVAIVFSACASHKPDTIPAPEPEDMDVGKAELPVSHVPFDRNDTAVRRVQDALRPLAPGGELEQYSAATLHAIGSRSRYSIVLVSKSDLEVIKAFVVSDLAPIVIVRSPVGPKHIRAVTGYDDSGERIVLIDPLNYAEMRFSYSEFLKMWDDPQDACLLVYPRHVIEEEVRGILTKYLSEEKAESVTIRVPRRR